ncbi:MAG TPA: rod shape-determining protein MreD [Aliiroseovarius sp.]|nr:rod shape-determining protein MreD [Aliiroseovarius sp.]
MIDPITFRLWSYRVLLLAMAFVITFIQLLPLSDGYGGLPGPDLFLALVFAWVVRRPEYVPVALVAVIVFLMDMLFQSPPGLRAALVVMGLEFLRRRAMQMRDMPFALEWGLVVAVLALVMLGERLVLAVFFVDQVSFGKSVLRLLITMATYPVVAAFSVYVLGVRRLQPGDADALRRGI